MDLIFKAEDLRYKYYGRIPALAGVSLDIPAGDRFSIIGSNGSGKSTLLQAMNGLIYPEGKLTFMGRTITEDGLREPEFLRYFRGRCGFVFQDSDVQLFSPTVMDELVFGPMQLGLAIDEAVARANDVMDLLAIRGLKDRPSYMLSGGEKKRVAIGSVLTMDPEALLLDEPTNGLDPKTQTFLIELIFNLNEAGKTIVIATHDLSLVSELNSTVAVMSEEHKVERVGTADDILSDEEMLLRVNLTHEHMHSHGGQTHRHLHSHFLFHRH